MREIKEESRLGEFGELKGRCPVRQPLSPAAQGCMRTWLQSCQVLLLFTSRKARNPEIDIYFPTNSNSLKHMGMAGDAEGGEQGTTVSGNKMSVASLSSWAAICNFSEEFSPRPSSYISVKWQRTDSGGGNTASEGQTWDPIGTCPL